MLGYALFERCLSHAAAKREACSPLLPSSITCSQPYGGCMPIVLELLGCLATLLLIPIPWPLAQEE